MKITEMHSVKPFQILGMSKCKTPRRVGVGSLKYMMRVNDAILTLV